MGQCGCGDINLIAAYSLPGTDAVLAVDEYWGCNYCDEGPGISLRLFDGEGWREWGVEVSGMPEKPEEIQPDEHGGNHGHGWGFPFVGQSDLVKAAKEDEELSAIRLSDYRCLADLLEDYGLHLLRAAMKRRSKR